MTIFPTTWLINNGVIEELAETSIKLFLRLGNFTVVQQNNFGERGENVSIWLLAAAGELVKSVDADKGDALETAASECDASETDVSGTAAFETTASETDA